MGSSDAATLGSLQQAVEQLTAEVRQLKTQLPSPFVDIQGVADHLGVSLRSVRRLVSAKEIAFVRVGRGLRFDLRQFTRGALAGRRD